MRYRETFLSQSLKNIKTVGTITRSSPYLCKEIIKQLTWTEPLIILELGAGDGVITKHILKKMSSDSKLISLEINPVFCEMLNEIKDKRLSIICVDALHLDLILSKFHIHQVDHVISAIPFVILSEENAIKIIQICHERLKDGGKFIQVHYSLLTKKLYERVFGFVQVKFVPFNIPPAFLLSMQKSNNSMDGNKS
jgi:phospholipid N-methyltransferase